MGQNSKQTHTHTHTHETLSHTLFREQPAWLPIVVVCKLEEDANATVFSVEEEQFHGSSAEEKALREEGGGELLFLIPRKHVNASGAASITTRVLQFSFVFVAAAAAATAAAVAAMWPTNVGLFPLDRREHRRSSRQTNKQTHPSPNRTT